jgi:hypothetical protein
LFLFLGWIIIVVRVRSVRARAVYVCCCCCCSYIHSSRLTLHRQQKKAKDEERKKKTEAAAALKGYRKTDLSSEEMKLATLREEERKKKAEAAALLQRYRQAGLSEVEAKKAAAKQEEIRRRQQTEERLRSANDVVKANDPVTVHSSLQNSGTVSAMAAQFGVAPEGSSPVKVEEEQIGGVPTTTPAAPENEDTTSTPVTSTINFMFGLIMAAADEPATDGYLMKADQIAKSILSTSGTKVSTISYPKVLSITKDDGEWYVGR